MRERGMYMYAYIDQMKIEIITNVKRLRLKYKIVKLVVKRG